MVQKKKKSFWKKPISLMLTFAICLSGASFAPWDSEDVKASNAISIANATELAKIGRDDAYPMDGDYVLTQDIDLSGQNWTPIGGATGPQYGLVSGERVFSGTFDGAGRKIEGLTIQYNGSQSSEGTNVSGLFAMIGSDDASDYAEVKNINFTEVSIEHTLGRGDTIGALTGDVNGFAKVDNIAVLGGNIHVLNSSGGDLIGVGGVVGQTRNNSSGVQMSNLYNAADVTVDSGVNTSPVRCGGILGRVHQQNVIGALTSCVNIGQISYKGEMGYAINGYSSNIDAPANIDHIANCYYLTGSGQDFEGSASIEATQTELASDAVVNKLGAEYWSVYNGQLLPIISEGKVVAPIPLPEFAPGESASSVTKDFTVPTSFISEAGEETITWTSDSPLIVIDNQTGTATVGATLVNTGVTLTAVTSVSKRTKTILITVISNADMSIVLDQEYAKPGTAMTASIPNAPAGTSFTYTWTTKNGSVNGASYTPKTEDLNTFLTVTATHEGATVNEKRIYCSKLPVVYIDTDDGYGITSKTEYKDATMRVQGNDTFNNSTTALYDGDISIRGRGNSTWNLGYNKLPYKLKLDTKTNLFGFGNSKHWALLANYMDESLLRNTTSYDLAGTMGITPHLKSTHVELILNGRYAGNYQLVGNVRIDDGRVDIFDWEDVAGDVAKAIGKKENISGDARDALEDYLNQNMQWITSDRFTYQGKSYTVSDYYQDIPKTADGKVDVSGGFLFELDTYFDEISKFYTTSRQPMMFKSPEFIRPTYGSGWNGLGDIEENPSYDNCDALFTYSQQYVQAVEDSIRAEDFYVDVKKQANADNAANFTEDFEGRRHYTELVDLDSLVNYLILNEFYWNTETMKKSTFMYKDLGKKLTIGPVWDMDWTSNSRVSAYETGNYEIWMVTTAGQQSQSESWYRYLIGDPYFVEKMYECYHNNRQNFDDIVKRGGIIDQDIEYLRESATENYNWGYIQHVSDFDSEAERLREYLKNRLNWMDQQFASLPNLLRSLGKYNASSQISVSANISQEATTTYTATVSGSSAKKVGFYLNGILIGTADITNGKATLTASDAHLDPSKSATNIIQVRGMDASGNLLGNIQNYTAFQKDVKTQALTGTVTISGRASVGSVLKAEVTDTNNSGVLSYQWKADNQAITDATTKNSYTLTAAEEGKQITVEVFSSIETGSLISEATEAVVKVETKNDHPLIHQVYAGGNNDTTPVTHSFIELYNPTDESIRLDGYALGYLSGGKNGAAPEEVRLTLDGEEIPAHHSYLIRCEEQDPATFTGFLQIHDFDKEWEQILDNKRYRLILYRGTEIADGVSVNEDSVEGEALPDGTISKQKAIRRKNFADTDNNTADFEVIEYRDADPAKIEANRPRSKKDGAWGTGTGPIDPEPAELTGTVSIRGNAIVGAILYADEATNNSGDLSYQWKADGVDIAGATGPFYELDAASLGKKISVVIASSVETGSLTAAMEDTATEVTPQRDHLIVHQVYGDGGKSDVPVSHSFIELYNPTSEEIDLSGYSIHYASKDKTETLSLQGKVPSRSSYLIQCAAANTTQAAVEVSNPDQTWDLSIDNKRYSVTLKDGETQVDGVSVNEAPVEGDTALVNPEGDEIISKNKAIRRIRFIDTDDNAYDFEVLNYSKLPQELILKTSPRRSADGAWGLQEEPPVNPVNKEILMAKIAEYRQTDATLYTPESFAAFLARIQEIEMAVNAVEHDLTEAERNLYLEELEKAFDKLEKVSTPVGPSANKQALLAKINAYKALDSKLYTAESFQNLQNLIARIESAMDSMSEAELQSNLAALENAYQSLQPASSGGQTPPDGQTPGNQTPPTDQEHPGPAPAMKKGDTKTVKGVQYKVLDAEKKTVAAYKAVKKTLSSSKTVTIPDTVTINGVKCKVVQISNNAFKGAKKLTTVTMGKNIKQIGKNAFYNNRKLKKLVFKSTTAPSIRTGAFKKTASKVTVTVPKKMNKSQKSKLQQRLKKAGIKKITVK